MNCSKPELDLKTPTWTLLASAFFGESPTWGTFARSWCKRVYAAAARSVTPRGNVASSSARNR
jgi:hypothetical protein